MRFSIGKHYAAEAIDFQDGVFFQGLIEEIDAIKVTYNDTILPKFSSEIFGKLISVIKRNTGITVDIKDGNPAIRMPKTTINHIFHTNDEKDLMEEFSNWDSSGDVRDIMKAMDKKVIEGSVDLQRSKVSGVFSKIEIQLYMSRRLFNIRCNYTSAETAAILLHELGHAFTAFEFLSRTVTTNQVMAGMVRSLDNTVPDKVREIIFARGAELLRMNEAQRTALFNTKDDKTLSVIVLDSAVQMSISELGKSVYDCVACEQLADQFATRHGAGRHLVTGLDKLAHDGIGDYGYLVLVPIFAKLLSSISMFHLTFGAAAGLSGFIVIALIVLATNKDNVEHDESKARFTRIKLQNVEQLKDRKISNDLKVELVETNEIIDKLLETYTDNLNFFELISYYVKPNYRNAHKYEILQKEIESISNNSLFTAAAKISIV